MRYWPQRNRLKKEALLHAIVCFRQKEFQIDKVPFSEELWEPMVLTLALWKIEMEKNTSNEFGGGSISEKMYETAVETLRH